MIIIMMCSLGLQIRAHAELEQRRVRARPQKRLTRKSVRMPAHLSIHMSMRMFMHIPRCTSTHMSPRPHTHIHKHVNEALSLDDVIARPPDTSAYTCLSTYLYTYPASAGEGGGPETDNYRSKISTSHNSS